MNAKFSLFITGNVILVLVLLIMVCALPRMNSNLNQSQEELSYIIRSIDDKVGIKQEAQLWDMKSLNARNTMMVLDGLRFDGARQYELLSDDLINTKVNSLTKWAEAADAQNLDSLRRAWNQMTVDQLNKETGQYALEYVRVVTNFKRDKRNLQEAIDKQRAVIGQLTLWGGVFQAIAVLCLAWSEVLFKINSKKMRNETGRK